MSKDQFNKAFENAISQSFQSSAAPDGLREKLLERLAEASQSPLPEGLDEEGLSHFESRLSKAVHQASEWAPEDAVALRTEATLSAEMQEDVLSERSVGAIASGEPVPESLGDLEVSEEKLRFVKTLRSEVRRSSGELKAPEEVRQALVARLEKNTRGSKVVPFPSREQWKRGLSALTSLAAGFALVFLTLFGSAETALANSVRADHQNCCRMAMAMPMPMKGKSGGLKAMLDSQFGKVPAPPVDSSWTLRVSQLCKSEDGHPMVHLLYARTAEDGKLETLSFHFIPNLKKDDDELALKQAELKTLSDGGFPVVGWLEGNWVCTACSPELDMAGLTREVDLGL